MQDGDIKCAVVSTLTTNDPAANCESPDQNEVALNNRENITEKLLKEAIHCCSPLGCQEDDTLLNVESDLDTEDIVQVVCSNDNCSESKYTATFKCYFVV